ncbi:MAG: ubiquinol-cytochrome c reductase cytochrome b subunit [Actinomycetota bacterium]|jgi:ubiquinol-cytochrome c reductase cytochrome b subunit|nr:ubiquinol-cytochrome c reductase cytochrome b subunit [Actinomycetota bacterium]
MGRKLFRWVDERLGTSHFARKAFDKIFPDHWSFMVGEIAMYCLVVLIVTGVYLTFFFVPASDQVVYHGAYKALEGTTMSAAYASSLHLSFEVRAGLVMRQMHHWAALVFLAALVVHLSRVFFTGAFRKPREVNWIIGVTLLVMSIMNGFFGYSLLDDLLSGTGVRVGYSIALSIPVAGEWLAFLFFGGEFPNTEFITRFFVLHVLLLPAMIVGLLGAHLAILWRQKHTQFKGPGRTETNIEGSRLWPSYAAKSVGLFFIVTAVLAALGGLAQINPVWLYGPYDAAQASAATAGSQPDWYVGWLDGALRVMPGWEIRAFGHTVANPFFPGAVLPGLTFGILYLWPFLERRFTKDRDAHNLLDRPRDAPVRTALGAATLSFYTILFIAGGNDVLSSVFRVAPESITNLFRALIFVVPVLAFFLTRSTCRSLARDQVHPFSGPVGSRVRRTPSGGYEEVEDQEEGDKPKVGSVRSTPETNPYRPPPAPPPPP